MSLRSRVNSAIFIFVGVNTENEPPFIFHRLQSPHYYSTMGASGSKPDYSANDFELAIKSSKELEYLLENEFHATGKGLHEKISSASSQLSPRLVKHMRYLATIRNKLVHERGFDAIPDRKYFIRNFEESVQDLKKIVDKRPGGGTSSSCVIS
jgi:hypothetical protein